MLYIRNTIFLIFLSLFPFVIQAENCIEGKDRETLDRFFSYLVHRTSLGYTLCGEKPLSTETLLSIKNIPRSQRRQVPKMIFQRYEYSTLRKGWECWERYSSLFPSSKFVFRFIEGFDNLVLINKDSCRAVIEDNIALFQKRLQTTENAQEIFLKICFPKKNEEILFKDNVLLGILYGYGKNNSVSFSNRCYFQNLSPFSNQGLFHPVIGYGFIIIDNGTNEKENKKACQMFEQARESVYQSFNGKNALDVFLKIYTEK